MTLAAGHKLGPYEVLSPLGAGGMGEVYKARDTRLDRTVALKVLPSHLASHPERRQRFEREAKAISALNHPHICTLHDVGHQDGIDFLVMEHLEGETLADRLKKGPLPVEQVLRYGVEIAEALDKAHRQGIVHRDLKPGNVMLTKSGTKLLDFGLAKLQAAAGAAADASELSSLPTGEKPLTAEGSIVGTFQYMAPEQLEGKEPDARTDIFALGAVLYEMTTGQRAFTAKSQASLITAIMSAEPAPIAQLQPLTPPALGRVVATCLAKDPDERWQNAHDLASELKWIVEAGSQAGVPAPVAARRRGRERLAWTAAVAAALLGIALGFAVAQLRSRPQPTLQVRFAIPPPEKASFPWWTLPAVSPDGQHVAFTAQVEDVSGLYVRALNAPVARPIPGTQGAYWPAWSPDGRQIAFGTLPPQNKLKKIDLSGGAPQTLCDLRSLHTGVAWGRDGVILVSMANDLFRVPSEGGEPKPVGKRAEGETGRSWPQFLSDGRRFLYFSQASKPQDQGIYVDSLGAPDRKRIIASDRNAAYASGHLLFMRGEMLMAQAFDARRLELSGEPFPLSEEVRTLRTFPPGSVYSVSESGVLAWRTGSVLESQLTWFDRAGRKQEALGAPADYTNPALSPDDRRVAVGLMDPQKKTRDLWVFDLVRGTRTRLTFDEADDLNPTWSPDGTRIAYSSGPQGGRQIQVRLANGSGAAETLLQFERADANLEDWSSDGRFMLYNFEDRPKPQSMHLLPLQGDRKPVPLLVTDFTTGMGQFSPNGRWIAYRSTESGRAEVYVMGVSPDGSAGSGKWQVSTSGGLEPRWRRDGKELFYVSNSTLMAVDVKTDGPSFEAGIPKALFDVPLPDSRRNRFVVTRDGQRFLVNVIPEKASDAAIHVLLNWRPSSR